MGNDVIDLHPAHTYIHLIRLRPKVQILGADTLNIPLVEVQLIRIFQENGKLFVV